MGTAWPGPEANTRLHKVSTCLPPLLKSRFQGLPGGPVAKKGSAPSAGAWVRSPVRELDSVCYSEDPASAKTLGAATNTRHSQVKKVKTPEREVTVREEDPKGNSEAEFPQFR